MSKSNDNGRALEARLVEVITLQNPEIQLIGSTPNDQIRDLIHFQALTENQKKDFTDFSIRYAQEITVQDIMAIERLKDTAAKQGDVTDIRIIYKDGSIRNISLKHNHDACKHQRPAALIKNQLGIMDKNLDLQYRRELNAIYEAFKAEVLPEDKEEGVYLFRLVKERNPDLIKNLYHDVCNLVKKYLLEHSDEESIKKYFKFLVGNITFEKVAVYPKIRTILIKDFTSVADATAVVEATIDPNNGHLIVKFDNNFILDMRLHTASSKFSLTKALSLKFDSVIDMENAPVTLESISF
ncbi:HaeIII family restriction endonuclease [Acinetobacter ursingii]|uniref:HaeIII family restriction endonuclease n=1 Tax=Acinetobacter ursingii TaxID=108980 RepID=UPI000E6A9CFB|nr:HaeIII family restriction endonuclease [Acinetobacter ursingii]MDG9861847.1 HaeIII family restriction endonuclease [Acinetobacter ursingii]MDG9895507.1 HaeIII family restriction endonuclease [Acinetobacter ursingii]MDH0009016.1 HaeIII family restriction endonuclease [Acinetobacter ursingii]MDH0193010.1 HaeIII family restriction endonuclease [Acinetobacter ursingii]MDH0480812.1 HaeIII family restriction endonuclease [Acinetobacter ursingii]